VANVIASQLDIPVLDRLSVYAGNFFGAGRVPITAQIGSEAFACRPSLFDAQFSDPVTVSGTLGSMPFVADIERSSVEQLLVRADPDLVLSELSSDNAALLLEFALEPVLGYIEVHAGQTVQIHRIDDVAPGKPFSNYGFECTIGSIGPLRIAISGHADIVNRLQVLAREQRPDYARIANLRQRVSFRIGYASFSLNELHALAPGDGIVVTQGSLEPGCVVAVMAESLLSVCQVTQVGPSLTGRFLPARNRILGDYLMSAEMPAHAPTTSKDNALRQLSDMPVKVVFELGNLDVPLYELANAGAGYVFTLPTSLNQGCAIISGGAIIGRGEVVRVGEQFAVRVVTLAAK
jgi:type III secretion protein Q